MMKLNIPKKFEWKNSGRGKYMLEKATVRSWVYYQMDVGAVHTTKFFLAVGSSSQVTQMLEAYHFWLK